MPAAMTNGVEREPEGLHRAVDRLEPTPGGRLEHREHGERETRSREHRTDGVEVRLRVGARRIGDPPVHRDDADRHDHLTEEHDPPGEVRGGVAPEDRPDRDACARHPTEDAIGRDAVSALVVAGDERRHGRHRECRADALEHGPTQREGGHGPRDGGEPGSTGVDRHADDEGPPAPDDVADLAARDHERRHHEGVEGDDTLDRGDGGVEVLDQLADRDVHDRCIEHHQELGR